jgi:TolA-binding protein
MDEQARETAGHPDEDTWVRLACGELDEPERERLASHVVQCAECATIYRGLAELRREAVSLDPTSRLHLPPRPVRPRSNLVTYALAAAATIAVLVGGAWFVTSRRDAPPSQIASEITPSPTPGTPAARSAASPRAWALVVPPDVVLPAGLAITMRGSDSGASEFLRAFGTAIEPYRAGNYEAATRTLRHLASTYPQSREARFYLAAALLLDGRARDALPLFAGNDWPDALRDDARWLHAVALERSGDPDAATAALEVLCEDDGPRRREACAAVERDAPANR